MGKTTTSAAMPPQRPPSEAGDELEQLGRDIERQIRSNKLFLQTFFDENSMDEEE